MALITDYFDLEEVVCKDVYDKYGIVAWSWMDKRLAETIVWLRGKINSPFYANNWKEGGIMVNGKLTIYDERGFRCNLCDLVKNAKGIYCTSHSRFQALDFVVQGMVAQEVRDWIKTKTLYLPHPIRLEDNVSWVHLDVCNDTNNKIVLF